MQSTNGLHCKTSTLPFVFDEFKFASSCCVSLATIGFCMDTFPGLKRPCEGFDFWWFPFVMASRFSLTYTGGFTGGNVSLIDSEEHNGQGGTSYISPLGKDAHFEPGTLHSRCTDWAQESTQMRFYTQRVATDLYSLLIQIIVCGFFDNKDICMR